MDPILSTQLAAAHRAELLRVAAARRRTATTHDYPLLAELASRLRGITVNLRRPATAQSPAVCCA